MVGSEKVHAEIWTPEVDELAAQARRHALQLAESVREISRALEKNATAAGWPEKAVAIIPGTFEWLLIMLEEV